MAGGIVQGTSGSGTADTGNPVKVGGVFNSTTPTFTNGQRADMQITAKGSLRTLMTGAVTVGADAQANNLVFPGRDDAAVETTLGYGLGTYGFVYNGASWDRQRGDTNGAYMVAKPVTSGGLLPARLVASAGGNIKASAGQIYGGIVTNTNAAIRFLHLYNKASAAVLSTDTPVATFALPPNQSVQITTDGMGEAFSAGISWTFTTDNVAIPTTAGATTDIHGTLFYK